MRRHATVVRIGIQKSDLRNHAAIVRYRFQSGLFGHIARRIFILRVDLRHSFRPSCEPIIVHITSSGPALFPNEIYC